MEKLLEWLAARPYRLTMANIAMLTALLAVMDSHSLVLMLGGVATAAAGIAFFVRVAASGNRTGPAPTLYQALLRWLPGALAAGLAAGSVYLAAGYEVDSLSRFFALLLFAGELTILAIASSDLGEDADPAGGLAERA